jgi:ferredoxin
MKIEIAEGVTVLDAALKCGISIPTLCTLPGYAPEASCMVCVVKDERSARFVPACASRVEEGMVIVTADAAVVRMRSAALDLLASEHVGDCEAPCRRGCPACIDMDAVLGLVGRHDIAGAAAVFDRDNPFPAILGRICGAPCEKVCRRRKADEAVAIKLIERFVGDAAQAGKFDMVPVAKTGKRVAIAGSGPAGLTAAYFLLQYGHSVTMYERQERVGGGLLATIDSGVLPSEVLDREFERLQALGLELRTKTAILKDIGFDDLKKNTHALLFATGTANGEMKNALKAAREGDGTDVLNMVFFTGSDAREQAGHPVMAARAVRQGREAARVIHEYLLTGIRAPEKRRFDSHLVGLTREELEIYLHEASQEKRTQILPGAFLKADAAAEAERCLFCACRKRTNCAFRDAVSDYCDERQTHLSTRAVVRRIRTHREVIFEPHKCIKCGRCVRICEAKREPLGLTFIGRGFSVEVGVPFGESLEQALSQTAQECVTACPTAALLFKENATTDLY